MTKDEIKEYLKDNLTVEVDIQEKRQYYGEVYKYVNVKLLLEDEVISETSDSL